MSAAAVKRFVPLMDRVLVQAFKAETKTAAGIYLPEAAKQSINQAKVGDWSPAALILLSTSY